MTTRCTWRTSVLRTSVLCLLAALAASTPARADEGDEDALLQAAGQHAERVASLARDVESATTALQASEHANDLFRVRIDLGMLSFELERRSTSAADAEATQAKLEQARARLQQALEATAELGRLQELADRAALIDEDFAPTRAALYERREALATADLLGGQVEKLSAALEALKARIAKLEEVLKTQKDPGVVARNRQRLERARAAAKKAAEALPGLKERLEAALSEARRLTGFSEDSVALEALRSLLDMARDKVNRTARQMGDLKNLLGGLMDPGGPPTLQEIHGEIFVRGDDGTTRSHEVVLQPGDVIRTGADGSAVLRFGDGGRVEVGPNTVLEFPADPTAAVQITGNASRYWRDWPRWLLKEAKDAYPNLPERRFRLNSGANVAVRGTDVLFLPEGDSMRVLVPSGEVEITARDGTVSTIRANFEARIDGEGYVAEPVPLDAEAFARAVASLRPGL